MSAREKPPWSWTHVVRACKNDVLSATEKLIWLEHYAFWNDHNGAWVSASRLAQRLGLGRRTVERARSRLLAWGLIEKEERGEGRDAAWFTTLPAACRPQRQRITDDEVQRLAECLATHVPASASNGGPPSASGGGGPHLKDSPPPPLGGGFLFGESELAGPPRVVLGGGPPPQHGGGFRYAESGADGEDGEDGPKSKTATQRKVGEEEKTRESAREEVEPPTALARAWDGCPLDPSQANEEAPEASEL